MTVVGGLLDRWIVGLLDRRTVGLFNNLPTTQSHDPTVKQSHTHLGIPFALPIPCLYNQIPKSCIFTMPYAAGAMDLAR